MNDLNSYARAREDFFLESLCYIVAGMKKQDIEKRIARQSNVSRAEAADRLQGVVNQILAALRGGRKTSLPGLGTFSRDPDGRAWFEREGGDDGAAKN
jgi:hypothetical protein